MENTVSKPVELDVLHDKIEDLKKKNKELKEKNEELLHMIDCVVQWYYSESFYVNSIHLDRLRDILKL